MSSFRWIPLAILAVSALSLSGSFAVVAANRAVGDFWQYEFTMEYNGAIVEGLYTVTMEETGSVESEDDEPYVRALSLRGTFYGTDKRVVPVNIDGSLSGLIYETGNALAIVMEESTIWANLTYDFGVRQSTVHEETWIKRLFSPPWFRDFEVDDPAFATSWVEEVNRTTSTVERRDGVVVNDESETQALSCLFDVAASYEECEVPAGEFEALEIWVTPGDGTFQKFWWSADVEHFVRQEDYVLGNPDPHFSAELLLYELNDDTWTELYVIVGVVSAVVAVAILGLVVMHRSRFGMPPDTTPREPPKGPPPGA